MTGRCSHFSKALTSAPERPVLGLLQKLCCAARKQSHHWNKPEKAIPPEAESAGARGKKVLKFSQLPSPFGSSRVVGGFREKVNTINHDQVRMARMLWTRKYSHICRVLWAFRFQFRDSRERLKFVFRHKGRSAPSPVTRSQNKAWSLSSGLEMEE
jgi:hypothetical protein